MTTPAKRRTGESGMALVMMMMLLAMMMSLLLGYYTLTHMGIRTTRSSMSGVDGLYAAEAGLNIRADEVRRIFIGYNRPAGAPPINADGYIPCAAGNNGSGDMACKAHGLAHDEAITYLEEAAENPIAIVIPRGERYQNLSAQEYRYTVESASYDADDNARAVLALHFKSRLVPLFQFAAFYNKDLEILPGPTMTLAGPVHTNGDLYLGSGDALGIDGQVTTAGDLYRGRKNQDTCMSGTVTVPDPENPQNLPVCSGSRLKITPPSLLPWNGMVEVGVDPVTVPQPEMIDPGGVYFQKADLRVVLDLGGETPAIRVHDPDGNANGADTAVLAGCGSVSHSDTFHNNREGVTIEMLDVDVIDLLDCLHNTTLMGPVKGLDESSEGGLVWYLGVTGSDVNTINNYGVRLTNAGTLASTVGGAPAIRGLTVVTNQAAYLQGDYNAVDKKPAAVLADSLNILSNDWSDASSTLDLDQRVAGSTTINAAFLAGTDSTGGVEGSAGQDGDEYNGGLENYPRFHETWSGRTLQYRGSFVSLNVPRHVEGAWVYGGDQYTAPIRDWGYDTDFDDASQLPPLSPRFVYLKQQLFLRQFEL